MNRKIIVTEDKSKTLLIPALNETYHSIHGALNESMHVFIQTGYQFLLPRKEMKIFEMGFGTGLNALVTLNEAFQSNTSVEYHSLEKYPITLDEINALNFESLEHLENAFYFKGLHDCDWGNIHAITPFFNLLKMHEDLLSIHLADAFYDLIYFDAFGPGTQADLWTSSVMAKMYKTLKPGGVLVTYCAQGQFKRNLKEAGFDIENLPGPAGKREITRAIKAISIG